MDSTARWTAVTQRNWLCSQRESHRKWMDSSEMESYWGQIYSVLGVVEVMMTQINWLLTEGNHIRDAFSLMDWDLDGLTQSTDEVAFGWTDSAHKWRHGSRLTLSIMEQHGGRLTDNWGMGQRHADWRVILMANVWRHSSISCPHSDYGGTLGSLPCVFSIAYT